jgi:hypothetical protein
MRRRLTPQPHGSNMVRLPQRLATFGVGVDSQREAMLGLSLPAWGERAARQGIAEISGPSERWVSDPLRGWFGELNKEERWRPTA